MTVRTNHCSGGFMTGLPQANARAFGNRLCGPQIRMDPIAVCARVAARPPFLNSDSAAATSHRANLPLLNQVKR
jgi:hypothetical protein